MAKKKKPPPKPSLAQNVQTQAEGLAQWGEGVVAALNAQGASITPVSVQQAAATIVAQVAPTVGLTAAQVEDTTAPADQPPPEPKGPGQGPVATVANLDGLSDAQIQNAKTVMAVGHSLGAPVRALVAAACIGWGENHWNSDSCNSGGYCGVFQVGPGWQAKHDWHDTGYWAEYAYRYGFYGKGGLIHLANTQPDASPGYIANECQGAYADLQAGARYYDQYAKLANDVVNAYIGVKGLPTFGGSPSAGSGGKAAPNVTIGSLFESLGWAGEFNVLWLHVQGGSNEAAHMADKYHTDILDTKYVKPSG